MRVTVYGHTGVVGSVLYRWLEKNTSVKLAGVSLDCRDGDYGQAPDWVFLCLPTPTGPGGQDQSIIGQTLRQLPDREMAVVIRSTVVPGTCENIAAQHPRWRVYHWPEFLSARRATADFWLPSAQVVGGDREEWQRTWHDILPLAIMGTVYVDRTTAEVIKYAHNCHGAMQVVFANLLYDMAQASGADFEAIKATMPKLGYIAPQTIQAYWDVFKDGGRGYAGACFPKDVDAIRHWLMGQAELLDGMAAANARLRGET